MQSLIMKEKDPLNSDKKEKYHLSKERKKKDHLTNDVKEHDHLNKEIIRLHLSIDKKDEYHHKRKSV
jgi:hypothetical protein